jgi:hypothetical protein
LSVKPVASEFEDEWGILLYFTDRIPHSYSPLVIRGSIGEYECDYEWDKGVDDAHSYSPIEIPALP